MKTAFINAKVWIKKKYFAQAFVIEKEKFLKIGTNEEILKEKFDHLIDLNNQVVIPGLIDTHIHFYFAAKYERYLDLSKAKSHKEAIDLIKKYLQKNKIEKDDLLIGYDWFEDQFIEKSMFRREELDKHFPDVSIFLWRRSYHSGLANTNTLKRLNIFYQNATYEDSFIELDDAGWPTGYLQEKIIYKTDSLISNASIEKEKKLLVKWAKKANQLGITGIYTCDLRNENWYRDFLIYEQLNNQNLLNLEIYHQLWMTDQHYRNQFLNSYSALKIKKNNHNLKAIKLFADGGLNRKILHLKDFDTPAFLEENSLAKLIVEINQKKLATVVHASSHIAGKIVAKAIIKADKENKFRNGIIHGTIIDDELLDLLSKYPINVSLQPCFLQMYPKESQLPLLRLRDLNKNKVKASLGTDWKVCDLNPWKNIYSALSHFHKKQRITLDQALKMYTINSAQYLGQEKKMGKIAANYYANFLVLNQDIFSIKTKQIKKTKPTQTWFRGKRVV
ncbi:amidohydrolase [Mesomycoplasma hyorhinis]|uniref:amidohydrolase n=1 Tax=Mesomycoplasma hyorhinis TaxID=2100 RepID=UPI001C03C374|nr:amidohydrolase family protein [Mesomycoplasma hyorhinis]UVT32572.1 amidohydrolase family protein [Mesomycoplasma hyorhinis]UVT33240.1 amidohydrolase family protein [Mesomycoplasma hyorhinis]UVT33912.1 amidohydrolase family protein [Mesomycoplasma hyorhinis]